jgi:hypothetical protein
MGMLEEERVKYRSLTTLETNPEVERSSAGGNQIFMLRVICNKTSQGISIKQSFINLMREILCGRKRY